MHITHVVLAVSRRTALTATTEQSSYDVAGPRAALLSTTSLAPRLKEMCTAALAVVARVVLPGAAACMHGGVDLGHISIRKINDVPLHGQSVRWPNATSIVSGWNAFWTATFPRDAPSQVNNFPHVLRSPSLHRPMSVRRPCALWTFVGDPNISKVLWASSILVQVRGTDPIGSAVSNKVSIQRIIHSETGEGDACDADVRRPSSRRSQQRAGC